MTTDHHPYSGYEDHPAMQLEAIHFERGGAWLAAQLDTEGYAHLVLEPHDMTRYEVAIVTRVAVDGHRLFVDPPARYAVASSLAALYPWNGNPTIHPDYAIGHYATNKQEWTGVVMARLLNHTADSLAKLKAGG